MNLKYIDINRMPPGGLELDQPVEVSYLDPEQPRSGKVSEVRLCARAEGDRRGVHLQGRISAKVQLECSRCLDRFEYLLDAGVELILVAQAPVHGSGESELDPEEALLFCAEEGKVDLESLSREQLNLQLPQKAVCRPDCAGLCPTCGTNKNRLKCGCRSENVDPRLAPLLDIKKRIGDA